MPRLDPGPHSGSSDESAWGIGGNARREATRHHGGGFGRAPAGGGARFPDAGHRTAGWGVAGSGEAWLPTTHTGYLIGGLEGAWVEGDLDVGVTIGGAGEFFRILGLDGDPLNGRTLCAASNLGSCVVDGSADSVFRRVSGYVGWGGDAGATRFGLGAYVALSELDFASIHVVDDLSAPAQGTLGAFAHLDEAVTTWSLGPVLVGETRMDLAPGSGVFLKGKLALLYAHGALEARQDVLDPLDASGDLHLSAIDRAGGVAGLAEVNLGFDHALGRATTLSVFGGASWRSDAFSVENPVAAVGTDVSVTNLDPVHLVQTGLVTLSVGGAVAIGF